MQHQMQHQKSLQNLRGVDGVRSGAGPTRAGWALLGGFAMAVVLFALSSGVDLREPASDWHGNVASSAGDR